MLPRFVRLLALSALSACRRDEPGPLGPLDDLGGEVTNDGLTLRGASDTAFAGVSLEVPAGALPAGTEVTLSAVFDGTPLPTGAERVGAQFAVDLGGEAPAQDLALTLPVDAGLVDRFAQGDGDVKVWVREGDGWALVEPDATDPGRVTVPIGGDAVAAAGVRTRVREASCGDGGACAGTAADVFDARSCGEVGLCGAVRATGVQTDGRAFAVDASGRGVVAVRPGPKTDAIMVIAVALDTGAVTEGPELRVSTADRLNPITDGTSNTIVVGTGFGGNVGFSLEDHVASAETVHLYAVGAVRSADGAALRLGVEGRSLFVDEGGRGEARVDLEGDGRPSVVVPLDRPDRLAFGDGSVRIVDVSGKELERLPPPAGQEIPAFAPLAAQGDAIAVVTAPGGVVAARFGADAPIDPIDLPVAAFDVAFDERGRLLVASADTPELFVIDGPGAAPRVFRLADGRPGDPAVDGALIRALRPSPAGGVVALHADGAVSTFVVP